MASVLLTKVVPDFQFLFSVCTIVNDLEEYSLMKSSFEEAGFTAECEYLIFDNSKLNTVDAYEAIAGFLKQAKGRYLVIVHQDVRCIDSKSQLVKCLEELTHIDPKWAICGNAGGNGYHSKIMHITCAGRVMLNENLPAPVNSLDENLLIINNATNLTISGDLSGYHLYGTDLCIIADFLGYTCYVIPFMVNHLSTGNLKALKPHIKPFISAYARKLRSRYIETTCTKFYLSNALSKNKAYNKGPGFSLVKAVQRVKQLARLLREGNQHKKIS